QGRAVDHLAPAPAVAGLAEPPAPVGDGAVEHAPGRVVVVPARYEVVGGPLQQEGGRLVLPERECRRDGVPGDRLQRDGRLQTHRDVTGTEDRPVLVQGDLVVVTGIVEARLDVRVE